MFRIIMIIVLIGITNSINANTYNADAATLNVELGLAYLNQGLYPASKNRLLTALQEDPEIAASWYSMGYYFEKTGDSVQAEKFYKKAISVEPNSGEAKNNYGTFLCRQRRYQEAILEFLSAARENSYLYTARAYENAGLCAMKIPNPVLAEQYFNQAVNQNPSMPQSLLNLAKLKAKSGHVKEANHYFNDFLNLTMSQQSPERIASYKRYVFSK